MNKRIAAILWIGMNLGAIAAETPKDVVPAVYPTAIFAFAERGKGVEGYGAKVSDLLFASLVVKPELYLVERDELAKNIQELTLNQSGMVNPDQAAKVGQLTGAKILVTGSVIEADKTLYLVAKIIGTETSRVLGDSIKGKMGDNLATLTEQLANKIAAKITGQTDVLMPKVEKREDRIADLKKKLEGVKRPIIMVRVTEQHVGQDIVDPVAETELTLICRETGFEVLAPDAALKADIVLQGQGFSEFAVRHGDLVTVKARLEIKAIDKQTDKIIAADRQIMVNVDLSERIAGKKALQDAAMAIAERLLPKLK